jgi:hypothetical protein
LAIFETTSAVEEAYWNSMPSVAKVLPSSYRDRIIVMTYKYPLNIVLLACAGCTSITSVRVVAPDQQRNEVATHQIALACVITRSLSRPNYTFAEDYLSPLAPTPSHGYLTDVCFDVESILKGVWAGDHLELRNAQAGQTISDAISLSVGNRFVVTFNETKDDCHKDWVLVRRSPAGGP